MYYISNILIFLINILNLSIKKLKSNKTTILACFDYFVDFLQLYFIRTRKINIVKNDSAIYCISNIFIRDIFIWNIFTLVISTKSIFIRDIYISMGLLNINS